MSELLMYINNQEALLAQYNGKIIALHGAEVIGEYPGKLDALNDMKARGMAPGTFLIVKCTPGDSWQFQYQSCGRGSYTADSKSK